MLLGVDLATTEVVVLVLGALAIVGIVTAGLAASASRRARRATRQLAKVESQDDLTGLPGRTGLARRVDALLGSGASTRFTVALVVLDRFGKLNDTYGYETGDHLLRAVSERLVDTVAGDQDLFRMSGPVFAVVAPGVADEATARELAVRLQHAVAAQYRIGHDHLRVTATVGLVVAPTHADGSQQVLDEAGAAVREAASRGPGNVEVFHPRMAESLASVDAQLRLTEALDEGELRLLYSPVVRLADGGIVGAEALLRWEHPEHGTVGAAEVFAMLDKTDLQSAVGEWVVAQACEDNLAWRERFPDRDFVTTINISPTQLAEPGFVERALQLVSQCGIDPSRLCLEITEGMLRTDFETAWRLLRRAKDAGLQLALDDFGVGYATFDWLRRFDLDVLKIARVFVDRVTGNDHDFAIVQQLVGLAHALDVVPIAEGVDRAEVADTLRTLDCDLAQGFYWGQPMPRDELTTLIGAGRVKPASAAPARPVRRAPVRRTAAPSTAATAATAATPPAPAPPPATPAASEPTPPAPPPPQAKKSSAGIAGEKR